MIRFGMIGTGRIAKRFVPEALCVESVDISAVYNPHEGSARKFVEDVWERESGRPEATDDLDSLWECVDAVYIASTHETHNEYIMQCLKHGKHVLCEKPMVLKGQEAKTCFSIADEKALVLMEGIKTAYCPGYRRLLDVASSGIIGEVKYIRSCFTKLEKNNSRELNDRKYGGSFTELGSYVVLPVLDLFGSGYESVRFSKIDNVLGLDIFTNMEMDYPGQIATVQCGLGVKSEGSLMIGGTKGYIKVDAPWWKTLHFEAHFENPGKTEKYDVPFEGDGLRYEITEFIRMIDKQDKDKIQAAADRSVCMAELMEKFLEETHEEI